jgi:hypothetical protein
MEWAIALVIALFLSRLLLRNWVLKRWILGGMSARRAALVWVATGQAAVLLIAAMIIVREGLPIVVAGLVLLLLVSGGLTFAIFDYMAAYGVKDHLRKVREQSQNR